MPAGRPARIPTRHGRPAVTPLSVQRRPRAPQALPWLVLAAHLLGLLLVGHALRPRDRAPAAAPRPLWLRLLPEPRPRAETSAAVRPRAPSQAPEPPSPRAARTEAEHPAPPTTPAPANTITLPPADGMAAPTAARPPDPPSSAPLDLRLPRGLRPAPPPAALARDDPRANTQHPSSEERLARALGTDQTLRESALPDGTRTFRRGNGCVAARPARESQLNPYNQSMQPTPRLIDDC